MIIEFDDLDVRYKARESDQWKTVGIDELIINYLDTRWIPVTERLPKKTDEYLVCYNDGDVSTDWYGFTDYGLIAGFDEDIIAWMERPKPYKEVEE